MVRFQTLGHIDLRDNHDHEIRAILTQPKRLAVLAYLAIASPAGFHRRDRLAALFWPESDSGKARAALSRVIYALRTELGPDVIVSRGDDEVALDFTKIECDVVHFEQRFQAGDYQHAVDLYYADLLPGFFVTEASPEFDQWLDTRRDQLRSMAGDAAWHLAETAEVNGNFVNAMRYGRRALELNPGNETWLRRVLTMLHRVGDRASAAGVYEQFARRLEQDFELEPSAETQELIAEIRARQPRRANGSAATTLDLIEPEQSVQKTKPRGIVAATAVVVVLAIFFGLKIVDSNAARTHVIAIGNIAVPADSLRGLGTKLTMNMARLNGVEVIPESRMLEFRSARGSRAANAAGATDLIEGAVISNPDGTLRFDVRRLNVRSGRIESAFSIHARNIEEVADLAVERIASDLGTSAPVDRVDGRTTSLVAYRFYEEALQTLYTSGNKDEAEQLLEAALREDSTFAMAAYYRGVTSKPEIYWQRAARYANKSSDRERLLIHAEWARFNSDQSFFAIAETLATRYPREADGQLIYARALMDRGRRLEAVPFLENVVSLDSAAIGHKGRCRACEALGVLANNYYDLDSIAAGERAVRRALALQPTSWGAWLLYAVMFQMKEDFPRALAILDSAAHVAPDRDVVLNAKTTIWARMGNYTLWDSYADDLYRSSDRDSREGALWGRTISFRMQGRYAEALKAAKEFHRARVDRKRDWTNEGDRLNEAIVLLESGKAEDAGRLFERMVHADTRPYSSTKAARQALYFGYAAMAYAAAGNKQKLLEMRDSIDIHAKETVHPSAIRMPHYVRALILASDRRHSDAIPHFRRAMLAPTFTIARIPLDFSRTLIEAGQPKEAIAILRGTLRGPISSVGLYATPTDLQETLGIAYERAGKPDSAVIQYQRVLHSWRRADPLLTDRKQRVQHRVSMLQGITPR